MKTRALAIFGCIRLAQACECAPPPPPCEAVGQHQLIFRGTVRSVAASAGGRFKTSSMRVTKVYKGQVPADVELFDDGMCDGPVLKVDREYLMYTWRTPGGGIPARGCSRSRAIEDATEDLRFLKDYESGSSVTSISGTVFHESKPTKGLGLVISGGNKEILTKTNGQGSYSVSNLSPGEYTVMVQVPGSKVPQETRTAELRPGGCAVVNLRLKLE